MKKTYQRFLAAGTTAALVASAVAPAASAVATHPFNDVPKNYEEAVSFLYDYEMIKGTSATTFGTQQNLTRGDAAVILANALGLDIENAPDAGFTDLNTRVKGSVNALADLGIVSGFDADTFKPQEKLSRGAMAKMIVLGFGLEDFAVETPFTDVGGSFAPYIEALYGTEITLGKTATSYGTMQNITRGDFANLLFRTFIFVGENFSYSLSAEIVDSKTISLTFEEAVPEEYTAQDIADLIYAEAIYSEDGEDFLELIPVNATLSEDRTVLTFEHEDLAGTSGYIWVDGHELDFDYAGPVAGEGLISLEGVTEAVAFDFAGTQLASVTLPATNGTHVDLNGLELTVLDNFVADQTVSVTLVSTTVEAVKPGEGKEWGTLQYTNGKWTLVDNEVYNVIPVGEYVLEAEMKDSANNTTKLTFNVTVE